MALAFIWLCASLGFAAAVMITTKGDIAAGATMFLFWWVFLAFYLWGK